jgi:hypothetical protein
MRASLGLLGRRYCHAEQSDLRASIHVAGTVGRFPVMAMSRFSRRARAMAGGRISLPVRPDFHED